MSKSEAESIMRETDSRHIFNVQYKNDKVSFIEIGRDENFTYLYNGVDLHKTKADELIKMIDEKSPYWRESPNLGTSYIFPEIGLSLWRPNVMTEEEMKKEWFLELPEEHQQEQLVNFYFTAIGVLQVKEDWLEIFGY